MARVRPSSAQGRPPRKAPPESPAEIKNQRRGRQPLKFGRGNGKLPSGVLTFSLPAGHFCPHARRCLSRADPVTGRLADGPDAQFRCYAASGEAWAPSVRAARWHNARLLRACRSRAEAVRLILDSLSPFAELVRVHDSGDFWSQAYFDSWLEVARARPGTTFYAYTKALPFWARRLALAGTGHAPGAVRNFVLTASRGGTHDRLIERHGLRSARVVLSEPEAAGLGLEVDHDDCHAMRHGADFALLIHGPQPRGTPAAAAVAALRARGEYGHGAGADAARVRSGRLPLRVIG
jgi:hypothetical protein